MQIGRTRCLLGFFLALLWSVAPFTLPAVNAQAQKIRISLSSRSNTNATYYVAQGKGFFKDEGLEVEFIQVNPRLGAMAVLNGDVTFTTSFVSTFRGVVQGLPMKTVFILLKKSIYFLMVRPEIIKDIQDLKGKKLGVTAVNGGDHIIGRELLRMKGLDPSLVQAIAVGEPSLRAQAVLSNVVQAVSVSPPHDLMLQQMGLKAISGPPEIGVPSSGLFAADRLIKENPQILRRTIRAALRANRRILRSPSQYGTTKTVTGIRRTTTHASALNASRYSWETMTPSRMRYVTRNQGVFRNCWNHFPRAARSSSRFTGRGDAGGC